MLFISRLAFAGALAVASASALTPAGAATLTTLKVLNGTTDGAYPQVGLAADAAGNLYGTAAQGGSGCGTVGCGTLFRLTPPATASGAWGFSVLYRFSGAQDGSSPAGLTVAADGTIYGVTRYGGGNPCLLGTTNVGCGSIFSFTPPASAGGAWTLATLYRFTGGTDGAYPSRSLVLDKAGRLITSAYGGKTCTNCGSILRLAPPATAGGTWTPLVLHAFTGGLDGGAPYGTPTLTAAGRVYGTTTVGGYTGTATCLAQAGCGLVYSLVPPGATGTTSAYKVIRTLTGPNGIAAVGQPAEDTATGQLYVAANAGGTLTACVPGGGAAPGCGAVLQLTPPATGSAVWTTAAIWRFTGGADGLYPVAGPTFLNGAVYGSTGDDGTHGFGKLFKLTPPALAGKPWTFTTLFTFTNDANGAQPLGALLPLSGALYGTTFGHDGAAPARYGTIFKLTE